MGKKVLIFISALAAGMVSGCLFGGESDTSAVIVKPDPDSAKDTSKTAKPVARSVAPGFYVGNYALADTGKTGLESEFTLNADGSYRFFYSLSDNPFYDLSGSWRQKDSAIYYFASKGASSGNYDGIFDTATAVEDDTTAITGVTDTSFRRLEYTPLRQKPIWITYVKRSPITVMSGTYFMDTTAVDATQDSLPPTALRFRVDLTQTGFTWSVNQNQVLVYQFDAKYSLAGSFLIATEYRAREADSTNTLGDWIALDGYAVLRLKPAGNDSFAMASTYFAFNPGAWEYYKKAP